jgi:hypothetical protein
MVHGGTKFRWTISRYLLRSVGEGTSCWGKKWSGFIGVKLSQGGFFIFNDGSERHGRRDEGNGNIGLVFTTRASPELS